MTDKIVSPKKSQIERLRELELTIERHKVYFKIIGVLTSTAFAVALGILLEKIL